MDHLFNSVQSANTSSTTETALYSTHYGGRGGYSRGHGRGTSAFRSTPYASSDRNCYTCRIQDAAGYCPENKTQSSCFSCADLTRRLADCPHTSLTQEQARRGRSAYSIYVTRKNSTRALANLAEETEEPQAASETTGESEPSF